MIVERVDRPVRLLLVAGPAVGGLRGHVVSLANELASGGAVEVTILAPAVTLGPFLQAQADGVNVESLPVGSWNPRDLFTARREIAAHAASADVVHAHGLRAGWAAVSANPAAPIVTTWHNAAVTTGPTLRLHRRLERRVARGSGLILAVAPDLEQRAIAAGARRTALIEIPVRPLPAVTVGSDTTRVTLGIAAYRPVVVQIARLEAQKRVDVAVDAAAGWGESGPILLIAGEGPLRTSLEQQISRLQAPVRLLGWRTDVADLLATADVALLTSDWEGWPAAAVDALRAGVPLVATNVGGLPRLVGDAAVLVSPRDATAARLAVERILTDTGLAGELATAAARRQCQWQDVTQSSAQHLQIYLDLMSS